MRILITGGTGMLGSSFKKIETLHDITLVGSKDFDLDLLYKWHSSTALTRVG